MNGTGSNIAISVGAQTDQGRREDNQDNMTGFNSPFGSVYIVADGMGGHRGGAEASRTVIEIYQKVLAACPEDLDLREALQRATTTANTEIRTRGQSGEGAVAGMGSTVVLAVVKESPRGFELSVGHIGDSRAYLLRDGFLRRLTRDHSAVQRLVDAQMLRPEEAKSHPEASVLTRALGQLPEVTIDVWGPESLQSGDVLMLCSDGLSGYVADEWIQQELAVSRPAQDTARSLIQLALRNGSDDNITVQVLRAAAGPSGGRGGAKGGGVPFGLENRENRGESDVHHDHPGVPVRPIVSHLVVLLLGMLIGGASVYAWMHRPPKNDQVTVKKDEPQPKKDKNLEQSDPHKDHNDAASGGNCGDTSTGHNGSPSQRRSNQSNSRNSTNGNKQNNTSGKPKQDPVEDQSAPANNDGSERSPSELPRQDSKPKPQGER